MNGDGKAVAEQKIFFRKDGITVVFTAGVGTGSKQTLDLSACDVQMITIEHCQEPKLFSKLPSERIKIKTHKAVHPIIYYRHEEKGMFFEYKLGLRKFARENKVRIEDRVEI